tara:strand:- start:5253 stop:5483 length:231 start_codon:yes stop_codon:yes gene_type:complete
MYKYKNTSVIKSHLQQMVKKDLIKEAKKIKKEYLETTPTESNSNYLLKLWELYKYSGILYHRIQLKENKKKPKYKK